MGIFDKFGEAEMSKLNSRLNKPLDAIDRLILWVTDPDTFDPISLEDAEEIVKHIEGLEKPPSTNPTT